MSWPYFRGLDHMHLFDAYCHINEMIINSVPGVVEVRDKIDEQYNEVVFIDYKTARCFAGKHAELNLIVVRCDDEFLVKGEVNSALELYI